MISVAVSGLLSPVPKEFVAAILGLALLGALGGGLGALCDESDREAALNHLSRYALGRACRQHRLAFWDVLSAPSHWQSSRSG